jgi:hypothetical protein
MQLIIVDERGDKPCTTELNGLVNDKVTITIGREGGVKVQGDPKLPEPSLPYVPYNWNLNPHLNIQPCNGVFYA